MPLLRIARATPRVLHDPFAEVGVFSSEELLGQVVTDAIRVLRRAGEMVIDPHFRRATEVRRKEKHLVRRLAALDFVLRKRAGRAHRKQLGRDADKTRQQQLLAIELRTETRHGVE